MSLCDVCDAHATIEVALRLSDPALRAIERSDPALRAIERSDPALRAVELSVIAPSGLRTGITVMRVCEAHRQVANHVTECLDESIGTLAWTRRTPDYAAD